jgi:glycosyltransferase involved in cell wall biosynthesis
MPSESHRARVVLATYNQPRELRLSLLGYLRQTTRDFSISVADDGSTGETAEVLERLRGEFEKRGIILDHVWQEDRGFRKTRILNEAVRRAEGARLLVFSDGDCIPPAHFVEHHVRAHEPRSFHVGGCYRLSAEVSETITAEDVETGRFERLGTPADRRKILKKRRKSFIGVALGMRNRPKVRGLNMAFDRALFEEINGFDEQFEGWGHEDSDLRNRAMQTRPRPRVKNLYGKVDVFHLWHPSRVSRRPDREIYRSARPERCELGLLDLRTPSSSSEGP